MTIPSFFSAALPLACYLNKRFLAAIKTSESNQFREGKEVRFRLKGIFQFYIQSFEKAPISKSKKKEKITMKKLTVLVLACLFLGAGMVLAADTDNHDVTVIVYPLNHLVLTGGNVTLTIDDVDGNLDPIDDTDNSTAVLWITNSATNKKITVALNSAYATGITLKALASGGTGGTPAAEVTLSASAQDFITGTSGEKGNRTINYTASADETAVPNNPGGETKTVTYTIVDQT